MPSCSPQSFTRKKLSSGLQCPCTRLVLDQSPSTTFTDWFFLFPYTFLKLGFSYGQSAFFMLSVAASIDRNMMSTANFLHLVQKKMAH